MIKHDLFMLKSYQSNGCSMGALVQTVTGAWSKVQNPEIS